MECAKRRATCGRSHTSELRQSRPPAKPLPIGVPHPPARASAMVRLTVPAITPIVVSLVLGAATVFGFAPFGFSALPVLTLSGLFALWRRAASPRTAAWLGFAFGLGLFGTGVSWLYIALAMFGGMAGVLAALATALFCAYLALFPAFAG